VKKLYLDAKLVYMNASDDGKDAFLRQPLPRSLPQQSLVRSGPLPQQVQATMDFESRRAQKSLMRLPPEMMKRTTNLKGRGFL
jgi:hypothetical protein